MSDKRVIPHGKTGYTAYGCRCDICKAATYAYMKAYREAKQQAAVKKSDSTA